MNNTVSVILVNYNGKQYNDRCIESILASRGVDAVQIVIVDNASTDGSREMLQLRWGMHEQIHIICLDHNYGFAEGNNAGITWALENGARYVMLLNNDTEIETGAISQMLGCLKKTEAIVVPKICYADRPDVIWCAGGSFTPVIKKAVQRGEGEADSGRYDKSGFCDFANGCCMLLSKEILEKLGLMDEKFFLYYEDTEYSMRAAKRQIRIYYCSEAVIYHKVNGSTKGNEKPANAYYITRNWLRCNQMHLGGRFYLFCMYFFFNRLAWAVIWSFQKRFDLVKAMGKGISDFRRGRFGKY